MVDTTKDTTDAMEAQNTNEAIEEPADEPAKETADETGKENADETVEETTKVDILDTELSHTTSPKDSDSTPWLEKIILIDDEGSKALTSVEEAPGRSDDVHEVTSRTMTKKELDQYLLTGLLAF
ncbi:hypothetical protein Droror1_Dr00027744 [Drosera rotundifolia]